MDRSGNLLDPSHLAQWRSEYTRAMRSFVQGSGGRVDAERDLRGLGYRSDAMVAEWKFWVKIRNQAQGRRV